MKKVLNLIYIALAVMVLPISCSQDFLNTQPLDRISSDATWGDGPLSEAFIFNVYSSLGYGGFEEQGLSAITDEAMFTHAGRNINTFTQGQESATNQAWLSDTYQWGPMYSALRKANIAIQNLPTSTFADDVLRDRLLGEAYFLRAYFNHQLLRFYGGFPIVDKPYGLDEDYTIARNTWEQCVTAIVADLDKAATLLEGKPKTKGRTNKLAALALKSRVLLYAASDLHHGPTAAAKSSLLGSYPKLEYLAYTGGDRAARWQAAKAAAKVVLDATTGYKLDLSAPVSAADGKQNYVSIALGAGSAVGDPAADKELLFERSHTALYTQEDNWPLGGIHNGINNGPNGYHNWAGNTPIQQLVDDYELMDGSKFDWTKPAHAADPYANRDPRFYASILYDGAAWKPRPADVAGIETMNQIQTGYYDDGKGNIINGVDTRESVIENWNGSRTHYYVRKFIDPDPALADNQSNAQEIPWPFIRYTEVVLNYVEAAIETGDENEARAWLNRIRFRAGMPAITDSGAALIDRYRNERRVELAYEEHRYHDVRRWMIAPQEFGRRIEAIDVKAKLKPGATAHVPYRYDKNVYDYTYTVFEEGSASELRVWVDKMYYRVINRDDVNRNSLLVQNPGLE